MRKQISLRTDMDFYGLIRTKQKTVSASINCKQNFDFFTSGIDFFSCIGQHL